MMRGARGQTAMAEIKIRMREPLRAQIERAAAARGVSMNAEMTSRLEMTFDTERREIDVLKPGLTLKYGADLARILLAIGEVMDTIGGFALFTKEGRTADRGRWRSDPYAFDQAIKAAELVLDRARPDGEIVEPPPVEDEERASKFWRMSYRYFLDHPLLDDLRRALAGEPSDGARADPYVYKGFEAIVADLNDENRDGEIE